jgi:hypothetical protein
MSRTQSRRLVMLLVFAAVPGALAARSDFSSSNSKARDSHPNLVETHGGVFITNSTQPSMAQTIAAHPEKKFSMQGTVQDIRSKVVYLSHDGRVTPIDATGLSFVRFVHKGEQVKVEGFHDASKEVASAIWGSRDNQPCLLAGK